MSWTCDKCKETFYYRDEIVLLCGENEVEDEDHHGSGDIDRVLCVSCWDEEHRTQVANDMRNTLVGEYVGQFDDEFGLNNDAVTFKLEEGKLTGTSISTDGKQFIMNEIAIIKEGIILYYEGKNSNGIVNLVIDKDANLKGIYMLTEFENLERSCGNYTLTRKTDS